MLNLTRFLIRLLGCLMCFDLSMKARYTVAVTVIDTFGNDTMTLVPINVG